VLRVVRKGERKVKIPLTRPRQRPWMPTWTPGTDGPCGPAGTCRLISRPRLSACTWWPGPWTRPAGAGHDG